MPLLDSELWTLCITPLANARPLWAEWSLAPAISLPFAAAVLLYAVGARGWPGRGAAYCGWTIMGLALFSPLCRLAADLVSAHMIQLALMSIVAPAFLAAGGALPAMRNGLRSVAKRRAPAPKTRAPLSLVVIAYGAAIWAWHVPSIYNAALVDSALHIGVMFILIAVSVWFFQRMLAAPALEIGAAVIALLVTMAHTGLLGALLTFARQSLYNADPVSLAEWGLSASSDQQLAGLIMWAPSGLLYLVIALVLTVRLIAEPAGMRSRS